MEPNDKKSNGALVGVIIVIIILVLGGIYMWNSKQAEEPVPVNSELNETENSAAAIGAYNELQIIGTDLDNNEPNVNSEIETVQ